jgi:hypothetical protein
VRYTLGTALIVVGVIASSAYQDGHEAWKFGVFWFGILLGVRLLLGPTVRRLWERRNASLVARGLKSPPSSELDADAATRQ